MSTGPFNNGVVGTLYWGTTAVILGQISQDIKFSFKNNISENVPDENGRVVGQRQDDMWTTFDCTAYVATGSYYMPGNVLTISSSLVPNGVMSFILDDSELAATNKGWAKGTIKGRNFQYLNSGSL